ncbi:hypothetical protein KBA63_04840 [Candidatus Woesebacteria bacterium]|nr:hypothetical protein [Candidatus Woesebacteria bacterium]
MLAARYKFSPRIVDGIFSKAFRSKKSGYSILVLPKEDAGSKMAVVLTSAVARTSIRRHAVKRKIYNYLENWVKASNNPTMNLEGKHFYLIVMVTDWKLAEPQLRTQDWKETIEYLLANN